ncbi:DnaD domain protein [Eubacterium sp. MSJ-33]|uniref:DnaD domain protein n=1 Tax=Eubacterium sp. MSJ-33 TaxID=2841528 RepID=UPI0015B233E6|nr:DnaD domain protein [Eubacterium sp. MSJ-33]QWT52076.1 DnaD domain protein [Eubacterium sp. MSJ-33]
MKSITISTENSETYSSISNFFIDYYMTDANGEFVKVYLYLIRLLNSRQQISIAEIADHFNLLEKDICRAIKYWVSKDVLRLTFDGKGQPTGIVVLPLHAPELELSTEPDAFSLLRSDDSSDITETSKAGKDVSTPEMIANPRQAEKATAKIVPINTPAMELSAPQKPAFTQKDLDKHLHDQDWEDIVYQVETLFGKPISASDTQSLMYIYDTLGFSVDLFEYLIEYCTTMRKKNCRYLEATAIGWYQDGIKTKTQAKEQYALMSGVCRVYYKTLGIRRSAPTTVEQEFFKTWTKDYGYNEAFVEEACRRACLHSQNPNIQYVNGILTKWHNSGITDFSGIEQEDLSHAENVKNQKTATPAKKGKNAFTNFTQSDLSSELDEMEKLFHKEVNGK